MKLITPTLLLLLLLLPFMSIAQLAAEQQIANAVLAAPENLRAEAKVYGFDEDGSFTMLREGTNHMVCIGDDPAKEGFSVAAYHKDLEPFMARGRELKAEGKSFQEIFDIREEEVKAGTLTMPDKTTLYVLTGALDESGNPVNTHLRYVVYIPFATPETTGLPTGPISAGGPWIMDPGTHRAHIMITPPRKD